MPIKLRRQRGMSTNMNGYRENEVLSDIFTFLDFEKKA